MMKLYADLMRQGIIPGQIDDTDLEDWFWMLAGDEPAASGLSSIDAIMGL